MTEQPTPSAPLTPEEVEIRKNLLILFADAVALVPTGIKETDDIYRWECFITEEMVRHVLGYFRTLQSQLKTRTEDAERMAKALGDIAPCGYRLGLSIVWCEEDEPVSARTAMEALSSLHNIYPPKQ